MIRRQRRAAVLEALRRGTVPKAGLDALAVGYGRVQGTLDDGLDAEAWRPDEASSKLSTVNTAQARPSSAVATRRTRCHAAARLPGEGHPAERGSSPARTRSIDDRRASVKLRS